MVHHNKESEHTRAAGLAWVFSLRVRVRWVESGRYAGGQSQNGDECEVAHFNRRELDMVASDVRLLRKKMW